MLGVGKVIDDDPNEKGAAVDDGGFISKNTDELAEVVTDESFLVTDPNPPIDAEAPKVNPPPVGGFPKLVDPNVVVPLPNVGLPKGELPNGSGLGTSASLFSSEGADSPALATALASTAAFAASATALAASLIPGLASTIGFTDSLVSDPELVLASDAGAGGTATPSVGVVACAADFSEGADLVSRICSSLEGDVCAFCLAVASSNFFFRMARASRLSFS